jgi:hypothetical protein
VPVRTCSCSPRLRGVQLSLDRHIAICLRLAAMHSRQDQEEKESKMLKKLRAAKNSWVMKSKDGDGFTPLPGEQRLYSSPPRTALSLQSPSSSSTSPGLSLHSGSGSVYLTNRRVVYLPAQPTPALQSFTAPLLNLHDTRVAAPFFGPNTWQAIVQPVHGGGLTSSSGAAAGVELRLTFKDGGAFDFHTTFERLKERLQQAVDNGVVSAAGLSGAGGGGLAGYNLAASVHLDELPAYEPESHGGRPTSYSTAVGQQPPDPHREAFAPQHTSKAEEAGMLPDSQPRTSASRVPPSTQSDVSSDPPPGYDEAQMDSVVEALENGRLRDTHTDK